MDVTPNDEEIVARVASELAPEKIWVGCLGTFGEVSDLFAGRTRDLALRAGAITLHGLNSTLDRLVEQQHYGKALDFWAEHYNGYYELQEVTI